MKIVLLNAAAPDYKWKRKYAPKDFAEAVREWEQTPVLPASVIAGKADGYHFYRADSLHARQTAELWLGEAEAGSCETTDLLNEIPLLPYTDTEREIAVWQYKLQGWRQWKKDDIRQPETYRESLARGQEICDLLEERGEDAVLISHERRILLLTEILRRRKFRIRRGSVFLLSPMERILAARDIPTCGSCAHNCQLAHPGCSIGEDKARLAAMKKRRKEDADRMLR